MVFNLLLKACMNGVSTISGGNEFQLFTTLILKVKIILHRLVHLNCLSFYICVL